eukprot:6334510-Alexandrium_andersonii.AAC.1
MSASLVGSEMCIRDRLRTLLRALARPPAVGIRADASGSQYPCLAVCFRLDRSSGHLFHSMR